MKLFLASKSPRRHELLQKAGIPFTVVSVEVSEIPDKNINAKEQILDIARRKARAAFASLHTKVEGAFLVLASDTEVVLDGELQGKPLDLNHAAATLRRLSGRPHEVMTAVVFIHSPSGTEYSQIETTHIQFRTLSEQEVQDYVASGEPMDRAGSYAIQGLGGKLVQTIQGDFENVVGLPMNVVLSLLKKIKEEQT